MSKGPSLHPTGPPAAEPLLAGLGRRIRDLRRSHGWSRGELAAQSGVSLRFLARVEGGEGNISVLRLAAVASALGTTPGRLLDSDDQRRQLICLVGMRGAGKSTIGPLVAERLGRPFIEIDARIVEAGGLPLDQLFQLHGERYYRRLEREAVEQIVASDAPAVIAAAGGVVNDLETWTMLCRACTVVWLKAPPEEHWARVLAQGDHRPMADNPSAMDELRAILSERERTYAQAELAFDTDTMTPDAIAQAIVSRLEPRAAQDPGA